MKYKIESNGKDYRVVEVETDRIMFDFKGGVGTKDQLTAIGDMGGCTVTITVTDTCNNTPETIRAVLNHSDVLEDTLVIGYPKWVTVLGTTKLFMDDTTVGTVHMKPKRGATKFQMKNGKHRYLTSLSVEPGVTLSIFNDYADRFLVGQVTLH